MSIYDERGHRLSRTPAQRAATIARISILTPVQCQRLLTRLRRPDILQEGSAGGLQRLVLVNYQSHYLRDSDIESALLEDQRV